MQSPSYLSKVNGKCGFGLHWVLVYLDDIIIFSYNVHQHLKQLRNVVICLKDAGLKVKPAKCHLFRAVFVIWGMSYLIE